MEYAIFYGHATNSDANDLQQFTENTTTNAALILRQNQQQFQQAESCQMLSLISQILCCTIDQQQKHRRDEPARSIFLETQLISNNSNSLIQSADMSARSSIKPDQLKVIHARIATWIRHAFAREYAGLNIGMPVLEVAGMPMLDVTAVTRNSHCMGYCCPICPGGTWHFVYDYSRDLMEHGGATSAVDTRQFLRCLRQALERDDRDLKMLNEIAGVFHGYWIRAFADTPRMPGGPIRPVIHPMRDPNSLATLRRRRVRRSAMRDRNARINAVARGLIANMVHALQERTIDI